MLLIVIYSWAVRTTFWNTRRAYDEVVVRQLGRAALFDETELATFPALRLREKHDEDVQTERTQPFNEFAAAPDAVRKAAAAYGDCRSPVMPYSKLASETDHPLIAEMQRREL